MNTWLAPRVVDPADKSMKAYKDRFHNIIFNGVNKDVHAESAHDTTVVAMHDSAERFDPRAEYVFKYLQVRGAAWLSALDARYCS